MIDTSGGVGARQKDCSRQSLPAKPQMKLPIADLSGKRFGRLIVIENWGLTDGKATYHCRCDCGKEVLFNRKQMRETKSCGCEAMFSPDKFSDVAEASMAYRKFYHQSKVR